MHLRSGDRVLELGAQLCETTQLICSKIGPQGKVLSKCTLTGSSYVSLRVEPLPGNRMNNDGDNTPPPLGSALLLDVARKDEVAAGRAAPRVPSARRAGGAARGGRDAEGGAARTARVESDEVLGAVEGVGGSAALGATGTMEAMGALGALYATGAAGADEAARGGRAYTGARVGGSGRAGVPAQRRFIALDHFRDWPAAVLEVW